MTLAVLVLLALVLCLPATEAEAQTPTPPKTVPLSVLAAEVNRLVQCLDALEATAPHELFRRHLRSVRGLIRAEEARASAYAGTKTDVTAQSLDYIKQMQRGFDADAAEWQTYRDGKRSLIIAYVSRHDNTLQHYALTLPRDWKPDQTYPLYLELHGAGDPHPLGWVFGQVGLPEGVSPAQYKRPTMVPMVERKGFHVYPYGRGNSGYQGIGEIDVWEALADAEATVKLDPERYYLFGFSMGGGGTWRIAARTPDKWAAIVMISPAGRAIQQEAAIGLGRNVSYLPAWMWIGADDFLLPSAHGIRDEIRRHGSSLVYIEVPKIGHSYLQEVQADAMRFLDGKVRARPAQFAYVSDADEHTGAWGIRMVRDLAISGTPSFECRIEGQTVHIDSKGTPGLTVDLPTLGVSGEALILWNGKEAYRGPAKQITVGTVPERRRF